MADARISYSSKDYSSLRKELIQRIPQITDRWTDFNESDLGMTLLELFCGVADMLVYYLDTQANEAYLPTARQRQNIINLCKLIGYKLKQPVSAQTTLRFSIDNPLPEPLTIPAETHCKTTETANPLYFVTLEDTVIPAGSLYVDALAIQGKWHTESFTSDGAPNQKISLRKSPVAEGFIKVAVGGEDWQPVATWYDSAGDSPHFQVETDALDNTSIVFGDGTFGKIPQLGTEIAIYYIINRGSEGNIGRGLVTKIEGSIYVQGKPANLHVTNITPATGGDERETHQHAKKKAPATLRSLWKAVTKEDYKALVEGFPGVAKAQVLDCNDCENIRYYQVNIVIAPNGGGQPSALLKQQLQEFLEQRKLITVEINFFDPVYKPIDIKATVYVYRGQDKNQVKTNVEQALKDMMAFDKVAFGQALHVSTIISTIQRVPGVSHTELVYPITDIYLNAVELPVPGAFEITVQEVA